MAVPDAPKQQYQQISVGSEVFRAYDIRGVVGEQLNEDAYYSIGRAFAWLAVNAGRHQVYLARDARLSSESLAMALRQGLLDNGLDVIDLGAVATPVLYFACASTETDSGLMVTGSHNPSDYNGIKMVLAGRTLVQADIEQLYRRVMNPEQIQSEGRLHFFDIRPAYRQRIVEGIQLQRRLKVVIDCGNSIAGEMIPSVVEALGCEVIPLYCDVDGRFPNHHPDPSVEENLEDLKKMVIQHQADIGLAFDGDADRLGVVTDRGQNIWPDRLMMLYAQAILAEVPAAKLVFDVKCSANLAKIIEASGGIPIMCPTGHSIVKAIMKEENAALAGEMSGHLFFKHRWYGFDDALYSAARLLEIISADSRKVSDQFADIPDSVNTPEIKIEIADHLKFDFMNQLARQAHFPDAQINRIDGLRVEFEKGWGLIRASNTTPCLVARFEADSEKELRRIQQLFRTELLKVNAELVIPFA